ncbi:hypothetical protein D3C81_1599590 [compost metagenome]
MAVMAVPVPVTAPMAMAMPVAMMVVAVPMPLMPPIPAAAVPVAVAMPAVITRRIDHRRRRRHVDWRRSNIDRGADLHANIDMGHGGTGGKQRHRARQQGGNKNRRQHWVSFLS